MTSPLLAQCRSPYGERQLNLAAAPGDDMEEDDPLGRGMKHPGERRTALRIQRPTFGVLRPQEYGPLQAQAFEGAVKRLRILRRSLERRSPIRSPLKPDFSVRIAGVAVMAVTQPCVETDRRTTDRELGGL